MSRNNAAAEPTVSDELFRMIVDHGQAMIWAAGPDRNRFYFNQPWLDFTGRTLEQELGTGWLDGVHPGDLTCCLDAYAQAFARREKFSTLYRLRRHDGAYRWILDDGAPRLDELGNFAGYIGHCLDITERKLAEDALRESEFKYRRLVDNSPLSILAFAPDGSLAHVNPAWERLWQLPFAAAREYNIFDDPQVEKSGNLALLRKAFAGESVELPEHLYDKAQTKGVPGIDGKVWLRAFAYPVKNEKNEVIEVILVQEDFTARKVAEDNLRKLSMAVEQSPESIVITNLAAEIEYVNEAFVRKTGYRREEVIGQNPAILNSGKTAPEAFKSLWAALVKGQSWEGEFHNKRKDGSEYLEHAVITPIHQTDGRITHYVAVKQDITDKRAAEERINALAFYDTLTELPNRRLLLDRMRHALLTGMRRGRGGALLFIDLDNFKTLNDTLGHDIGDLLLQQVAARLTTCIRDGDTVARFGGDEFVVMLEDLDAATEQAAAQAKHVGEKIMAALNQPYQLGNYPHHSTPSIGITLFSGHHQSGDDLLKQADLAMYQAKAAGRNTLTFFDPEMQSLLLDRAALEGDLREAMQKNQFLLHYQPQVIGDDRLIGAEALLRWQHPRRGLVPPDEFIPLAEDTGLILPLGRWVLEAACRQLAAWANAPGLAQLSIAVNVSARQFRQPDFVEEVLDILARSGATPQRLKLELTESLLIEDVENIIAKMTALKLKGVGFSLDDFGTGYSSLSYLKRLPLDQMKIDQSFVRDILTDPNDAAIAKMVVALAESMGLTVIAEGVELEAQKQFLARHGCHAYQGYLFSRPLPLREFEAYARNS